jgi:hypothetical protein
VKQKVFESALPESHCRLLASCGSLP